MTANGAAIIFGIAFLALLIIFSPSEPKEGHPMKVRELMEQLTAVLLAEGDIPVVSEWDQHVHSIEVSEDEPIAVVILFETEEPNG
jgi:hypothetical protein